MGIKLMSLNGRKISSITRFFYQCYLCWKQNRIYDQKVKLCNNYGKNSLSKIALSIVSNGHLVLHRKAENLTKKYYKSKKGQLLSNKVKRDINMQVEKRNLQFSKTDTTNLYLISISVFSKDQIIIRMENKKNISISNDAAAIFQIYDRSGTGQISKKSLIDYLSIIDGLITDQWLNKLLLQHGLSLKQYINCDDFIKIILILIVVSQGHDDPDIENSGQN